MKNNNGFTLIEVLVATSIILMLVATIVPVSTLVQVEKKILFDRRIILLALHDDLQETIWGDRKIENKQQNINHHIVEIYYSVDNKLIKGCASWENEKKKEETVCLYGYREK